MLLVIPIPHDMGVCVFRGQEAGDIVREEKPDWKEIVVLSNYG